MSDSLPKNKQENLLRFFDIISSDKTIIKIQDIDSFEKDLIDNKELKDQEKEIIELINDLTYFAILKLDIKITGIDETLINKIVF